MEYIRKTQVMSLLPADVRAGNVSSRDFNIVPWHGLAKFVLDAEAQGGGKEVTVKLQDSNDILLAAGYDKDTSLGDTILRSGVDTNMKLAARFTQAGAGQVKKVALQLKAAGTIADGKIVTVSVYTEDSNAPDVLLGTSKNVLCADIGKEYGYVEFEFEVPVDLVDKADYFVVLEGDYNTSGTNCIKVLTDTVTSGGNFIHYTDSWQAATDTKSLCFNVWEYRFSDITGGGFTKVENEAATESIVVNIDNCKSYIRAVTTGASSNTGATCLVMIGAKKYPV